MVTKPKTANAAPKPSSGPKPSRPPKNAPAPKPPPAAGAVPKPPSREKTPVAKALGRRKPAVAREMLTVELRRVRSLFAEIAERYLAESDGKIVALIEETEKRRLPMPAVEGLLKEVRSLNVKPRKGRRKDLGRIEALVEAIRKSLD
jgi:hypothetical protein